MDILKGLRETLAHIDNIESDVRQKDAKIKSLQARIEHLHKELIEANKQGKAVKALRVLERYSDVQICKSCEGEGGHEWQNPDGSADGHACADCGGNGVVKKPVEIG